MNMNFELSDPLLFKLPLRGSNEDHLDVITGAGETYGAGIAERTAANMRIAERLGLECKTVRDFLNELRAVGLPVIATQIAICASRLSVRISATVNRYLIAVVREDLEGTCSDLRRRGYRENQIRRFRVKAWRVFKLNLREAAKYRTQ